MGLLGVEVPLPGHKLNGGRLRDRECDGTDSGELTEVTRDGGVSRAGFGRYAVGMLCLGQSRDRGERAAGVRSGLGIQQGLAGGVELVAEFLAEAVVG